MDWFKCNKHYCRECCSEDVYVCGEYHECSVCAYGWDHRHPLIDTVRDVVSELSTFLRKKVTRPSRDELAYRTFLKVNNLL